MSAQIDKLLEIAKAELGYLEKKSNAQLDSKTANAGSGNYTKYWRDLKPSYQGSFWCYCFVSWCARRAGIPASILPTCYSCGEGVTWYTVRGQWIERTMIAKPGDLVFFKDKAGRTAHIGIVYKVDGRIYTYEGNSSSVAVVTPNGGAVVEKVYAANYDRIVGYARPKYEEDDIVTPDQFRAMYKTMIAETHGDEHSAWADEVIKKAVSSGLFQGNNGNFEWKDPLSREEFAAVLDRLGLLG